MAQGSRLHRPRASSYTSVVVVQLSPATMMHSPTAAHAKLFRGSSIGGIGSHRSMSPFMVSASRDVVRVKVLSWPPKTAKRPSLSTHVPPSICETLVSGKYLHRRLVACGGAGGAGDDSSEFGKHGVGLRVVGPDAGGGDVRRLRRAHPKVLNPRS